MNFRPHLLKRLLVDESNVQHMVKVSTSVELKILLLSQDFKASAAIIGNFFSDWFSLERFHFYYSHSPMITAHPLTLSKRVTLSPTLCSHLGIHLVTPASCWPVAILLHRSIPASFSLPDPNITSSLPRTASPFSPTADS